MKVKQCQISQDLLRRYYVLAAKVKMLKSKRKKIRDLIVKMLEKGRTVQPGQLEAQLRRCEARALTKQAVVEAVGEEEYEWLRTQITPQLRKCLFVVETKK